VSTSVYLPDARTHRRGWSKQELTVLRHAANVLSATGLSLETDSGVTDEGEPWFVFCDASGGVFAHFARISGTFVVYGLCINGSLTERVLPDLVERFLDCCPRGVASLRSHSTPAA
jgi:hypothetical protein